MSEKVVLVTGSSRGIGEAISLAFAKQGANLSITGRNKELLAAVAQKCKENGAKQVLETIGDVLKQDDMDRLMNATIQTFGKLDVLVNNAGIFLWDSKGIEGWDTDNIFDEMFGINLKAPIYLTKIAKPHLIASKGNIVNISSSAVEFPLPELLLYGMTKSCINHLTKTTAAGLAKDGVRCNAVSPGSIRTEIFSHSMSEQEIKWMFDLQDSLIGRSPTVEEAADLVTFLASDKAAIITGECVLVNGGSQLMR